MKGEILIKYPNYKGIVSRNVEIQQPAINWNKIDFVGVSSGVSFIDNCSKECSIRRSTNNETL